MKPSRSILAPLRVFSPRMTLATALIVALAVVSAFGQTAPPPSTPVDLVPLNPYEAGIRLEQISFEFDAGQAVNSDFGQIVVDPVQWRLASGLDSGYLNVMVGVERPRRPDGSPGGIEWSWAVHNMRMAPHLTQPCDPDGTAASVPLTAGFDLVPGTIATGRRLSVPAVFLASAQPVPVVERIVELAPLYVPTSTRVQAVRIDAEGYLGEEDTGPGSSGPLAGMQLVGLAPAIPSGPPEPPLNLAYPIEIFQDNQPNIESAKNQCVPLAMANVLAYLENRYDGGMLIWSLPHSHTQGLGRIGLSGDIVVWSPDPIGSLVSQVDTRTHRLNTHDRRTGYGSDICQLVQGTLGYLSQHGDLARTVCRHRGTDSDILGDGGSCEHSGIDYNGRTSQRVGPAPTWQWIFDELQAGHGVALCYGRYNTSGKRTGGHMLRVWGAGRYNGEDFIFTLDDADQSDDNAGLRWKQWLVADTGGPGQPGVPDGRLNLDGMSWEIEFGISVEAVPYLNIP